MGQGEDTVLAFCRVRSSRTEIILISLPAGQGRIAMEWTAISEHSEPSVARRIFIAFDEAGDRGDGFRTISTEQGAERSTACAMLPRRNREIAPSPRDPITIRSAFHSRATSGITFFGYPN